MKPHLWFIRAMSHLVPQRWRSEWKQEWDAELQHGAAQGRSRLFRRSLGAFWDAVAMQPRRLEEEVFQDLRFGVRMFSKDKALTITAIVSLALGIGVNTALFSMVDAVLLKKLPVKNPDELILFQWLGSGNGIVTGITSDRNVTLGRTGGDTFSYRAFQEFRRRNETLADVYAFAKPYNVSLRADDKAEIGNGQWVSGKFFSGLGVGTALGRTITEEDDKPSSTPVAMISYSYWQKRFALSPDVQGKTIRVNDAPFTIVALRNSRIDPDVCRLLRGHGVQRRSPHQRTRRPDGTGGKAIGCPAPRDARRIVPGRHWCRPWHRRCSFIGSLY